MSVSSNLLNLRDLLKNGPVPYCYNTVISFSPADIAFEHPFRNPLLKIESVYNAHQHSGFAAALRQLRKNNFTVRSAAARLGNTLCYGFDHLFSVKVNNVGWS